MDYVVVPRPAKPRVDGAGELDRRAAAAQSALHLLSYESVVDPLPVAAALGYAPRPGGLDAGVEARGYRLLHRLPRVSDLVIDRIVTRFETVPRILQASVGDLEKAGGMSGARARSLKNGLSRLVEASILERYD